MLKLTDTDVAEIRASERVYRPADVARHYDVHPSTVKRIWDQEIRAGIKPADEPPNIEARKRAKEIADDIRILLSRGMSVKEIAERMEVGLSTVYAARGIYY